MEAGVSAAQSVMVLKQTQDTCSHAGSALMSPWQVRIPSSWIFHFPACPTPSDKSQDFPRLSQTDPAERRRMAWGGADCFCFDSSSSSSSSCEIVNWVERTIISSCPPHCFSMWPLSYSPISAAVYNWAQNLGP